MQPIEIVVIIIAVLIVVGYLAVFIYKKVAHKPTGECACCKSSMKRGISKVSKELKKEKKCCCK